MLSPTKDDLAYIRNQYMLIVSIEAETIFAFAKCTIYDCQALDWVGH